MGRVDVEQMTRPVVRVEGRLLRDMSVFAALVNISRLSGYGYDGRSTYV